MSYLKWKVHFVISALGSIAGVRIEPHDARRLDAAENLAFDLDVAHAQEIAADRQVSADDRRHSRDQVRQAAR